MIILALISFVIVTGCILGVVKSYDWSKLYALGVVLFALVFLVAILASVKWQLSEQNLTGYIYQRSEGWGHAVYSIRFSQNAGMDAQPSFCTNAGSESDKEISKYVGTDTKVQIKVPKSGLRFVNNPFECASESEFAGVITEAPTTIGE